MTIKKWQGLRDDLSVMADEGMLTATNVSYQVTGECRRRPGLGENKIEESGTLVTEWSDNFGTAYLVFNVGDGRLRTVKISDGTEKTVLSGISTQRGSFTKSNGRLYFTNGFNPMCRLTIASGTTETAGITAPAAVIGSPAATAGSTTSGTHLLRYRYFDSKSLYMSDPSPALSYSATGPQTLTFSIGAAGTNIIRSTDSKVDQVIIEMTDSASSTYYRAATVNQILTGTTVSMADADLVLQVAASRDGEFSHQPPPLAKFITEHRARLFAWGQLNVTLTGVTLATGASAGSATVTGATMSSGWAGFLMRVDGDSKQYRIAAMSGTGLASLSEVYTGTAAVKTGVQFFSPTPDMLYWTRAGFPESWNPLSFARRVLQNQADTPAGEHSFNEVLYLFGQRTIRGLDFASDPALGQIQQIATEMGLWNNNCLVEAAGYLFGWGRSGAWYLSGQLPIHISKGIDDTLEDDVDVSKSEQFHGVYNPRERCITWFYCTSSDTYPKHAFTWDLDNEQMTQRLWYQSILASTQITGGSTGVTQAYLADENGYTWPMANNKHDGVPASMSGGVVTVFTASTTVVTVSGATFATGTASNLKGVMATKSPNSTPESRVIVSNTSSTFTVLPAFSAAPTTDDNVYLGSIPVTIRSKWIDFGSLDQKKRPSHISIKKVPGTSAGQVKVGFYFDFSTTANAFSKGASDLDPDGVTMVDGALYVTVDLDGGSGDGVAYVPMSASWSRCVSVFLTCDRPQDVLKLIDVSFVIKNGRSVIEVTDE